MIFFWALCLLTLLPIWMAVDLFIGKKRHNRRHNKIEYPTRMSECLFFTEGKKLYNSLFQDIYEAKDHIHTMFFIIKDDEVSHKFLHLLMKKADEGVTVRLLADRIGCYKIRKQTIQQLKAKGIHFTYARPPKFPLFFYTFNQRNHRKITVIDGKIGYLGGFNIGKEYIGLDTTLGEWRDFHLKLTGQGVQDLQYQFMSDWHLETKEDLAKEKRYFPMIENGRIQHRFLSTNGAHMKDVFLSFIHRAKEEIIIGSPYFIPGRQLKEAIIEACKRGVKVSVLIPMKSDHPLVKAGSFPYFKPLLDAGCSFYSYYYGFYHSKVFIVDHELCDIGTANFDKRSMFTNFEMNCLIFDADFIQSVKTQMHHDFGHSEPLTLEHVKNRSFIDKGKEKVATLLSYFL